MVKLRINEYERELLTGENNAQESELFKPKKLAQQYNASDYNLDKVYKEAIVEVKKGDLGNLLSDVEFKVVESKKIEPQVLEVYTDAESKLSSDAKKQKVKALQAMADLIKNGGGIKNVAFATAKKPIDEIYDCVIVEKGVPVESDRVYYGSNNRIAFWDRDDATVFYVNWEGKYYRFANSSQFNKFCKDNNLK